MGRNRAESSAIYASERSESMSSAQRHFLQQDRIPEMGPAHATGQEDEQIEPTTFLSSPNGSSLGSPDDVDTEPMVRIPLKPLDLYNKYRQEQAALPERPPESQHPAHRPRPFEPKQSSQAELDQPIALARLRIEESSQPAECETSEPKGSPTLGSASGLSGMVRQHLRSDSNTSSNYGGNGMPSSGLTSRFPQDTTEPLPHHTEYAAKHNPWEAEEWDQRQSDYGGNDFHLEDALRSAHTDDITPKPPSTRSPNIYTGQDSRNPAWEKELEYRHTRDGSLETQKEQLNFKNDLAAHRRIVQENLKSFIETESRSTTPFPAAELSRDTATQQSSRCPETEIEPRLFGK